MLAMGVKDLEVYKLAFRLQQSVFDSTQSFPVEEKYSMTDQIRRSSRSVGANLSEAWSKRKYPAHFVSKLSDADGEAEETIHWAESACACRYISEQTKSELIDGYRHVSGMLYKMMKNAQAWCKSYLVNEDKAEYGVKV